MSKPLAIDLYCGLGGWTEGLLAEGWDVIGFDNEMHVYGEHRYPAQLVLQDVRTIHGSQLKHASLIVASSPCQEFSWRAMPWKLAKAAPPPYLGMELFAQAERIQREAIAAAGHFIPMVQENVRGAQKYVGRARWHYGSFYLWGDVPALMPIASAVKVSTMGAGWYPLGHPKHVPGLAFNTQANGVKIGGSRGDDWFTHHNREEFTHRAGLSVPVECRGCDTSAVISSERVEVDLENFRRAHLHCVGSEVIVGRAEARDRVTKNDGGSWFNIAHNTTSGHGQNPVNAAHESGVKGFTPHGQPLGKNELGRKHGSKSKARKAASARIAKIPLPLARHIARVYYPQTTQSA